MAIPKFLKNLAVPAMMPQSGASARMMGGGMSKTHKLVYQLQTQTQTNWCWAAVSASVSWCYDNNTVWTQCKIANEVLSRNDCCTNGHDCNQQGRLDIALRKTSNYREIVTGKIDFQTICDELDNGRPVCCLINWTGGGSGHFIAITGYVTGISGDEYIYVSDPIYQETRVAFDEFADQYQQGAKWNYTFPTQPATIGGAVVSLQTAIPHDELLGGGCDGHLR